MCAGRCCDKDALHNLIIKDVIKPGRCFYSFKFALNKLCFAFTGHADVFQRHLQVVKHRVEVGQAVLSHADEGILTLVGLIQIALGAHTLIAVDELLYHDFNSL